MSLCLIARIFLCRTSKVTGWRAGRRRGPSERVPAIRSTVLFGFLCIHLSLRCEGLFSSRFLKAIQNANSPKAEPSPYGKNDCQDGSTYFPIFVPSDPPSTLKNQRKCVKARPPSRNETAASRAFFVKVPTTANTIENGRHPMPLQNII